MMNAKSKKRDFMFLAIDEAKRNFSTLDGGPFGACIVKNGRVLSLGRSTVLRDQDPTCHAEMNAIREAAHKLKTFDLSDYEIYSTTEPCPMCFSAIHWARLNKIYFGTSIADVQHRGFNELTVANSKMKKLGKSKVKIQAKFARKECLDLLRAWDKLSDRPTY